MNREELTELYGPVWISGGDLCPLTLMGEYHLINLRLKIEGTINAMGNAIAAAELFGRSIAQYKGEKIEIEVLLKWIEALKYWLDTTQAELDRRGLVVQKEPSSSYSIDELIEREV